MCISKSQNHIIGEYYQETHPWFIKNLVYVSVEFSNYFLHES